MRGLTSLIRLLNQQILIVLKSYYEHCVSMQNYVCYTVLMIFSTMFSCNLKETQQNVGCYDAFSK